MGTRSTIAFKEKYYSDTTGKWKIRNICKIYNQYDGYLSGVGRTIVDFLKSGKITNGISHIDKKIKLFNGIGCLAAQYISENKDGPGNLYMTSLSDSQEYDYGIIWYWGKGGIQPDKIMILYNKKEYTINDFEKLVIKDELK